MAALMHNESKRKYSWWWDSHNSPKNSKWLQENLTDMDRNVKAMIKLIEEDADSFARRAEMYYKKRPELMKLIEEFYRTYRSLAERYDHATGALRQAHRTMAEAFPNQIPPLLNDESPSSSTGSEVGPRTPEMHSPLQAPLDPDDLNVDSMGLSSHFHVRRRFAPFSDENELLASKKGLKQLKELFPSGEVLTHPNSTEGKVRKGLTFKEEGGKTEEIKRLQDQVSELSSRNENLMTQITSESHRARILEDIVSKLEAEKKVALLRYKVSIERISTLETDITNTRGELNNISDATVMKLSSVEEQCLTVEEANRSLQFELEIRKKELEKRGLELEELNTSIEEEHQKRAEAQEEIQIGIERLKQMELNRSDLEKKISELKEIINRLHEQNNSCDIKIRDLQDEIKSLKDTKKRLEDELRDYMEEKEALQQELWCVKEDRNGLEERHQGLTKQMETISVKNELLKNSLSYATFEVRGLREKSEGLEGFCDALVGEVSTHDVEKGVMVSHIKGISQSMERLLEKNTFLVNSLSNANDELEGLRAMYRYLEESCMSLGDQNASLLSEKNNLILEVENFESKNLNLQEQQLKLEREKDLALLEITELENSFKLEKQEHEALVLSYSSQLASLHNQINLLQEDIQVMEKNVEVEQEKAIDSLFENLILQRSLSDMKDNNMVLSKECQNLLEASRCAEDCISQLKHEEFILKKELALLSEHNEILKEGITVLSEELSIDVKHMKTRDAITTESLLQTISGEVKSLVTAILDARDKNQLLQLEVVNLESKYLNLQDQHSNLEREKDTLVHKVTELESSSIQEKQQHESLILSLSGELASLQNEIQHLHEKIHVKEDDFEVEQQKTLNALLENFVLKRCLCDIQDENLILSGECQTLLEASRCAEQLICKLQDKEFVQNKELSFLKGRILVLCNALNIDVEHGPEGELKDDVLLQAILGEIKSLLISLSDAHDENERLHLEKPLLLTLFEQISLDKFNLHHELESRSEELLASESKKHELTEINEHLNSEKNILLSQVVNLESKYLNLQEQYSSLVIENDSLVHENLDLQSSSTVEQQKHEALILSLSGQLASLLNEINHLEEEIHIRDENFEVEQQKTMNALFENFVFKRCLCDMKDKNVILADEGSSLLEAFKCAEQQICQLKDTVLIQKKELLSLSNHSGTLRAGILLLSETLNIDAKHESVDELKDEVLLQAILGEIKSLLSSISDAHNDNQRLCLEALVLVTLFKQIGLDKFHLHRELERRNEELLALESKTYELNEINEQLCSEKSILVSQGEIFRQNLEILEKKYSLLEGKCMNLEKEKESILHQVFELESFLGLEKKEHQSLILSSKNQVASLETQLHLLDDEKRVIEEELDMEQQKTLSSLQEIFILQRSFHELNEKNMLLSKECQKVLEAYSSSLKLIAKLEHEGRIQQKQMMLLMSNSDKLRDGVLLLLKELNINSECQTIDGSNYEELLQTLNGEIKILLNSLSNADLQISVLVTLLKHVGLERSHLFHELESRAEEMFALQNKKDEVMEKNGQLIAQLQISETEICNLHEENCSLLERFTNLKQEKDALEEENINVILEALTKDHLFIYFESTCVEKELQSILLHDDIRCLLAVKNDLSEEIKVQSKRMQEMKIVKEIEVAEALKENAEICKKLEHINKDLDVAYLEKKDLEDNVQILLSGNASKDEKIMGFMEANGLLLKEVKRLNSELDVFKRREACLTSELKEISSEANESEGEIEILLNDLQFSVINAAILEEKLFELRLAYEGHEVSDFLHREKFREEIFHKNACVDELKKKLDDLEGENSTLKTDLDACSLLLVSLYDSIASLEEHIFLLTKIQQRQDDETSDAPGNKNSGHKAEKAGLLELQKLIPKVEALQKMIIDTKTLLKQEKLVSNANLEAARKEIEELKLKESSKERYGLITKDIQLDQVASSYRIKNADSDDQILELWETAERDDIEEVKSEYPSSELVPEKELSIDKLAVSTKVKESHREWIKKFTEMLDSDDQRLSVVQKSLHGLKAKLESSEKKKHPKSSEYGSLKLQLKEAEECISEQANFNGKLKKMAEDSLEEQERRQISEEARKGSEKIGKLELEVQKIEYVFLKFEEEEEDKKARHITRKSSVLLRDYIDTRRDGKGKRRAVFCGCMRPKTKASTDC